MPRKRKTTEISNSQEQPYDSSFKALLDDQTTAMLSFLLGEEVLSAYELKESLFKPKTVSPPYASTVLMWYGILSVRVKRGEWTL